jgi:Xaa-Pro aminopeptidase
MTTPSFRINTPISTGELERRWKAIRTNMETRGVDVLVIQANNDYMGGTLRYLTDIPAGNGYPISFVFPREGATTLVCQGPFHGDRQVSLTDDQLRGIDRVLTTPSFATVAYSRYYDGELIKQALAGYEHATIGLPANAEATYPTIEYLRNELPDATFIECWDVVDEVKMIKSPEEQELIRRTCEAQDAALAAAFAALQPGMREGEFTALAEYTARCMGTEQGIYLCASWKPGSSFPMGPPHLQNKRFEEGDMLRLLVECNGPGGYYAELGRMASVGPVPAHMQEEYAFTLEAQDYCVSLLVDGALCADVYEEYNAFMVRNGRPTEQRIHCHGQGYDLVERPLIRFDEPTTIRNGMNITCHPSYDFGGGSDIFVCDNYLIASGGAPERLHKTSREIQVLGS